MKSRLLSIILRFSMSNNGKPFSPLFSTDLFFSDWRGLIIQGLHTNLNIIWYDFTKDRDDSRGTLIDIHSKWKLSIRNQDLREQRNRKTLGYSIYCEGYIIYRNFTTTPSYFVYFFTSHCIFQPKNSIIKSEKLRNF